MRQLNWRSAAIMALTSSVFAAYAVAQAPATSSENKSGSSQNSASNSSGQGQNQTSNNTNTNANTSNNSSKNTQGSNDAKSSQDQNNSQDQSRQRRADSSNDNGRNQNSDSNRTSSDSRDRNSSRDRDSRDTANTDRDDRSNTRDRSNRDYDRNDDRNADSRSRSDRDRDSSRDQSSRRGNLRGPDIGIWFSRSSRDALVISDVSSRGAIAKLGFREGDRIVSVNGHRVTREGEFINYLLHGDARRVTVVVLRDNREETIYVEPAVLTDEYEYVEVDPLERFGIIVDDRYDDRIVVWRVIPRSPAYYAGFRAGDVIVKFGDRPYRTRTEFERGSRDWKSGDVNVQIRRGDRTRDLSVEIPNSDRSSRRTSERSVIRDERTAQRDSDTSDQRTTTDKNQSTNNDQRDNNNRGGILNNIRGRGSR